VTENAPLPGTNTDHDTPGRPLRADAQRNLDSLLEAAKAVFATSGVDAPAKEVADRAGVGVGTFYRHFPQRSDLVIAVLAHEIDDCADAAAALSAEHDPWTALVQWVQRYTELVATKQGLAAALHSGGPAFKELLEYFWQRFGPAVGSLLYAAAANGDICGDVRAEDLLYSVACLCIPMGDAEVAYNQRMVSLLLDGLRYRADPSPSRS